MTGAAARHAMFAMTGQQVVWGVLWAGLVLLTVALLVLMRTRWGQSQPLRKCVVLSLLAHLLFGCYATTVEIVHSASRAFSEPLPVRITSILSDDEHQTDHESSDAAAMPWETFATATTAIPPPTTPDRLTTDQLSEPERHSSPDLLTSVPQPAAVPSALVESPAPTPLDISSAGQSQAAISTAQVIQPLEPRRADAPSVTPPEVAPLDKPLPEPQKRSISASGGDRPSALDELPTLPVPEVTASAADSANEPLAAALRAPSYPSLVDAPQATAPEPVQADVIDGIVPPPELPRASSARPSALVPGETFPNRPGESASLLDRPPQLGEGGPSNEPPPVPAVLQLRVAPDRARQAEQRGGTATSEAAVQAALEWLADNQSADGRWSASQFQAGRELRTLGQERPGAGAKADSGVTGLALLAFLGAGHTHLKGPHQQTVQRGLEFLRRAQRSDGNLGGNASAYELMYCHGMATIALSEAYALTQDPRLDLPVRRAVAYTLNAQHPSTGGWRYRPGDLGDTSQLGWQLMALKSAEMAGVPVPARARDGMLRYLRSVASGQRGGLASYRPGEMQSRTMTAEALVCRQFLGLPLDDPAADEAAAFLVEELPSAEHTNVYYWYYATLALFRLQGEPWRQWNEALQTALISQQRNEGDLAGSWDPDPVWGGYGGRVYSTALSALCLEVYYRYLPLHLEAASRDAHRLRR